MLPRETLPSTNGPSIFTQNHSPNSQWSVNAFHTRDTGALISIFLSIMLVIRNLQVADHYKPFLAMRNHFVALSSGGLTG